MLLVPALTIQKVTMSARMNVSSCVAALLWLLLTGVASFSTPVCPKVSPATGLPNQWYTWKEGQRIRYQSCGPRDGEPVLLVHGLFVNSDHWRKTLKALGDAGYHCFALDLFGCGYSDKPPASSAVAQRCNGEISRFDDHPAIVQGVELGTPTGIGSRIRNVDLRHPLQSPYNFYTWADLVTDFSRDVVLHDDTMHQDVTLVSNSIGAISCLQAVIDTPELFKGVFVVAPNFRELHSAEVALPAISMPVIRRVQELLRKYGQAAFDALAKPGPVKQILKEPYAVDEAVDDVLVDVLLTPLLTEGASQVVFDTLSYSAGPLPEQQLQSFPPNKPVWICYGKADPWTPGPRVEALARLPAVERVQGWEAVGHCPHDEAPELVRPMLLEFLQRVGAPAAAVQG